MNFNTPHKREIGIIIGIGLLLLVAGLISLLKPREVSSVPNQQMIAPGTYTVEGEYVCLPHRNTDGPQTLECAFGIRMADGNHLALDLGKLLYTNSTFNYPMGSTLQVTGHVVPIEAISSSHWQIYANVRGIMQVESVKLVK